ncbi:MAG: thiamine pyrophosphate-dependent enzyme [Quadrisphaera sp.]
MTSPMTSPVSGPVVREPASAMTRFSAMEALAAQLSDELVVLSLGGAVDEWYTAAPHLREASLFQQQLGCVTPQALGLAAGLPHRRVVSLDTDGGLLFNLGVLATLGNERPGNLLVVVWDNERYQSIGGPRTHTSSGTVDLAAIARGAGVVHASTVRDVGSFAAACAAGLADTAAPHVVVAKVDTSPEGHAAAGHPVVRRKHSDGREDTYRFVRHVEATEGVMIMGPSEHN